MGSQIVSHPLEPAGFVIKRAIELRFEGGFEGRGKLRAGLDAKADQVPAQQDGLGGHVLDREPLGRGAEMVEAADGLRRDSRLAIDAT